jgi:Fic family protein
MITKLKEQSHRGYLVQLQWDAQPHALGGRRAKRGFAYEAYVPASIANEDFLLASHIAAAAANAEQACRELNDDPPALASLEALARQLLRAESVASSGIEGLVLSHRRLAKAAFAADTRDLTAQGVLANIAALEKAVAIATDAEEFRPADLLEIHRILFAGTREEHLGGSVREEQNWIGGAASSPHGAEFVPPPYELVPELLDDLCAFASRDDVPAVIQAAIAHAQFETIHPFHDGNGRVGRALILGILRRRGLAPRYLPPVSLALAGEADRYVSGLTSWRNGDEEDWYTVFVDAVYRASTGARSFADELAELQGRWASQAGNPRANSGPLRLIALLPSQPIIDVRTAAQLLGGTEERARQAVLRLEQAGVLRLTSVGRRNRAWECVGLFDLLDRFERQLGPAARTPRRPARPVWIGTDARR